MCTPRLGHGNDCRGNWGDVEEAHGRGEGSE